VNAEAEGNSDSAKGMDQDTPSRLPVLERQIFNWGLSVVRVASSLDLHESPVTE